MKLILKPFSVFLITLIIIEILIKVNGTGIANVIAIILYIILIIWLYSKYSKIYLIINNCTYSIKEIISMSILSCIIFICSYISVTGFLTFLIPNYSNDNMNLIEKISAVIFAPISEEILFRGIVLNQIMKKHSFLFANIFQSGIFAILHCDLRTFAILFLVGIMLGIVCNYLNLYCSILIHSLNNLINVLLMNTSIEFIRLQKQEYLIIGVVFFIITASLLFKIKTNKNMIYNKFV